MDDRKVGDFFDGSGANNDGTANVGLPVEVATWANNRAEFVFDGALIDLIAPGTDVLNWEAFWSALRSGPFGLKCFRDGELIPLPDSATWLAAEEKLASVMVSILVGTMTANCHFFGGELEFDIDPREVICDTEFESVLTLMRFVADSIGSTVLATPEGGGVAAAFLSVSPAGQTLYLPPRFDRTAEQAG